MFWVIVDDCSAVSSCSQVLSDLPGASWWSWEADQLSKVADLTARNHGFLLNTGTELDGI